MQWKAGSVGFDRNLSFKEGGEIMKKLLLIIMLIIFGSALDMTSVMQLPY